MSSLTPLDPDVPQFFFDEGWIDYHQRISRRWFEAKIYPEPVIVSDQPWEGPTVNLFGSVVPDPDGGYRMYYYNWVPQTGCSTVLTANSTDGLNWSKPFCNNVEWQGNCKNNIILKSKRHLDSPNVIYEPDDKNAPYKLFVFEENHIGADKDKEFGLYAYYSKDGYNFKPAKDRPCLRAGDRTSLMDTKPNGKYVAYTRHIEMGKLAGCRSVFRTESENFMDWSEPELVLKPDLADDPQIEFYGMSVFQRNGWSLGLLEYWDSFKDVIETHLAFSRDGVNWMRPADRQPFIRASYSWNKTWNTPASSSPLIINGEMLFYFGGRCVSHGFDSVNQGGVIGRASLGMDRFCALEGIGENSCFVTPPLIWPGGDLVLNADTRQLSTSHPNNLDGNICVEVLSENGESLKEWAGTKKATFKGNTHCRGKIFDGSVNWPDNRSLDNLKGKIVKLRFTLDRSRLFTFECRSK